MQAFQATNATPSLDPATMIAFLVNDLEAALHAASLGKAVPEAISDRLKTAKSFVQAQSQGWSGRSRDNVAVLPQRPYDGVVRMPIEMCINHFRACAGGNVSLDSERSLLFCADFLRDHGPKTQG